MRKTLTTTALLTTLLALVVPALAADHEQGKGDESVKVEVQKSDKEKSEPAPAEKAVTTSHSLQLGGRSIAYKATAGTLTIRDDKGKPDASIFYVAYTADGEDGSRRPVTFLYNGGPGSSSIWLHMGSFAPVRIVTASPEATAPAPYQLVPNADSLLDKTDLVFVDAIGTGYSKGPAQRQGRVRQTWQRRQGGQSEQALLGHRRRHRCVRPFRAALHHREQPLELAEVPVRRILRHAALGRAGQISGGQGHRLQWRGPAVVDPELRHATSRPGQRLRRQPAHLRRDRLVPQQAREQAGDAGTVPDRSAQFRARRICRRAEQGPGARRRGSRCGRERKLNKYTGLGVPISRKRTCASTRAAFPQGAAARRPPHPGPLRRSLRRHGQRCRRRESGDPTLPTRRSPAPSPRRSTTTSCASCTIPATYPTTSRPRPSWTGTGNTRCLARSVPCRCRSWLATSAPRCAPIRI